MDGGGQYKSSSFSETGGHFGDEQINQIRRQTSFFRSPAKIRERRISPAGGGMEARHRVAAARLESE